LQPTRPISAIRQDLEILLADQLLDAHAVTPLAEEVAVHAEGLQVVDLLLTLLERNQDLDWGAPGAVVHAVEKFYKKGYEALLFESLHRFPTSHTLWMANRIMTGVPNEQREPYLSMLQAAAERTDVSDEVRVTALHFLKVQANRK
jgi:hypothetical protein